MPNALRLSFVYRDGKWILTHARRVQMRVPPSNAIQKLDESSGAWIELRDGKGQPLYRRVISRDLVSPDIEVRTGDPVQSFTRQRGARRTGTLHAVIPDLPDAREFAVLERGRRAVDGRTTRESRVETVEHARVDLRTIDRGQRPR